MLKKPGTVIFAFKHVSDFFCGHRVEVVRHFKLALRKTNATLTFFSGRRHIGDRLADLGNDKRLTLCHAFEQARQMGLGFVDVDGFYAYRLVN